MKTLIIATLTTALISFNSFADTTTDIQNSANIMVKKSIQQMHKTFTTRLANEIKNSLSHTLWHAHTDSPVLIVKANNKKFRQPKHNVQAADE
jgi:hypothetical protein